MNEPPKVPPPAGAQTGMGVLLHAVRAMHGDMSKMGQRVAGIFELLKQDRAALRAENDRLRVQRNVAWWLAAVFLVGLGVAIGVR